MKELPPRSFLNYTMCTNDDDDHRRKKVPAKVKRSVTQPAKSTIERTICSHPMLKRVQKEVRELKKKSAEKYEK